MDHDRHAMVVGRAEYPPNPFDVRGIVVVDDGVAEVELEPTAEVRVFGAPRQLLERVVLQRVEAAESDQPIRERGDLPAGPVVVASDLFGGASALREGCSKMYAVDSTTARLIPAASSCAISSSAVLGAADDAGGVVDISLASSGLNRC